MRIYLIGFMGAGKSFWGRKLAQHFQAPFFDLDDYIVEKENRSIQKIFADEGEAFFRSLEQKYLQELTNTHPSIILATGGGTPCFHQNMDWMNQHGKTIWLNPPLNVLVERLSKGKQHRPLLSALTDEELPLFIQEKLNSRIEFYQQSTMIVNKGDDLTVNELIKLINHA